jgi:hypothetical protein
MVLAIEAKEFRLTPAGQSVMYSFTASDFGRQFCFSVLQARRAGKTEKVPQVEAFSKAR